MTYYCFSAALASLRELAVSQMLSPVWTAGSPPVDFKWTSKRHRLSLSCQGSQHSSWHSCDVQLSSTSACDIIQVSWCVFRQSPLLEGSDLAHHQESLAKDWGLVTRWSATDVTCKTIILHGHHCCRYWIWFERLLFVSFHLIEGKAYSPLQAWCPRNFQSSTVDASLPLHQQLQICRLPQRMDYKLLVFTYRYTHSLASTLLTNEFSVLGQSNARTRSITRGQSFISLSLPNVCHRSGTISPLFICSLLWNSLPSSLWHHDVDFSRFRNALSTFMGFPVTKHT